MSLKNKVAIVTGASSGIGAATAIIFAREGASVAIVGRNEANLNSVAEKCGQVGKKALAIRADVSKDADAAAIISKTIEKFGKLDVLVNNAGIMRVNPILEKNHVALFDEVMNTNVRSIVMLTNLAVPHLIQSKGNIVNVSSVAASLNHPTHSAYATSKAALNRYSKVAAAELGAKGVRVNIVSPGPVDTPIFESLKPGMKAEDVSSITILNKVSVPAEIGALIAYVASDKAGSITGSEYVIDCGTLVKT